MYSTCPTSTKTLELRSHRPAMLGFFAQFKETVCHNPLQKSEDSDAVHLYNFYLFSQHFLFYSKS